MRRIVTLLNQVAVTVENSAGLQAQMDSAVKAAKLHQDDNVMLTQVRLNQSLTTELKLFLSCSPKAGSFPQLPQCVISNSIYIVSFSITFTFSFQNVWDSCTPFKVWRHYCILYFHSVIEYCFCDLYSICAVFCCW